MDFKHKWENTKKPKRNYLNSDLNIDVDGIEIQKQPDDTVQIVNNTNENYLHVFCQHSLPSDNWEKEGGSLNAIIYTKIDWGRKKQIVQQIMRGDHWEQS